MKRCIAGVALVLACVLAHAQPRLPTKAEEADFRRLAAQTALHVEVSLAKIAKWGPMGSPEVLRQEIAVPAAALRKTWFVPGLSDAVMMTFSACTTALANIQTYSIEVITPPRYHLDMLTMKRNKFIQEDLAECKKLQTAKLDYPFARQ